MGLFFFIAAKAPVLLSFNLTFYILLLAFCYRKSHTRRQGGFDEMADAVDQGSVRDPKLITNEPSSSPPLLVSSMQSRTAPFRALATLSRLKVRNVPFVLDAD